MVNKDLPVIEVLSALKRALTQHATIILKAPPGAGKSTLVPLELLNESWLNGKHIWLLEPRRLAAQAVAQRLAHTLSEPLGQTIGLKMRLTTIHSKATRLFVLTEGVATKLIRQDPELNDVGLIIFDEFHERSVPVDLALSLSLDARRLFNPSLKLLVMSATLDDRLLEPILGSVPIIESQGKQYPVAVHHLNQEPRALVPALASSVEKAFRSETGDILVFCPGVGEIQAVKLLLQERQLPDCQIMPLYGDLPIEQQAAVLTPSSTSYRKIILATNVAETSVTIDGVRIVVDSGLARRARFDPNCGFSRLALEPVARANLEQRRGRAGRTAPGVCYRVFTESNERQRVAFAPPQIIDTDCAALALEVIDWGTPINELKWVDTPPSGAWQQAIQLLEQLEATKNGTLTNLGKQMLSLGAHPRLAAMMLKAPPSSQRLACRLAALLGERDIHGRHEAPDCDIDTRLQLLKSGNRHAGRILQVAQQYERSLKNIWSQSSHQSMGALNSSVATSHVSEWDKMQSLDQSVSGPLLMLAYPDRIAKALSAGRYQLRNGQIASFAAPDRLSQKPYLVIADLQGGVQESRVRLAAEIDATDINELYLTQIETVSGIKLDSGSQSLVRFEIKRLGKINLSERIERDLADDEAAPVLVKEIREQRRTPWEHSTNCTAWLARVRFLQNTLNAEQSSPVASKAIVDWPSFDQRALMESLEEWAIPFLNGVRRMDALINVAWLSALHYRLGDRGVRQVDEWAPASIIVPTGNRITIDYSQDPPRIAVRLQEIFGMTDTPRVANGSISLAIELLSPARRPVQVTRDLLSFWKSGYFEVRKELKGRYPKHYWPDDPLIAEPTARAKPRPR